MARAGRKRKSRGYNPGHKPVNEPKEQKLGMTPEMFDQRKRVVGEGFVERRVVKSEQNPSGVEKVHVVLAWDGTQIHALALRKLITQAQLDEGRRFENLAKKMRSLMCVPKEGQGAPQRAAYHDDPEEFAKIKDRYESACAAMGGLVYVREINKLLRDEQFNLAKVKVALSRLVDFYA